MAPVEGGSSKRVFGFLSCQVSLSTGFGQTSDSQRSILFCRLAWYFFIFAHNGGSARHANEPNRPSPSQSTNNIV